MAKIHIALSSFSDLPREAKFELLSRAVGKLLPIERSEDLEQPSVVIKLRHITFEQSFWNVLCQVFTSQALQVSLVIVTLCLVSLRIVIESSLLDFMHRLSPLPKCA